MLSGIHNLKKYNQDHDNFQATLDIAVRPCLNMKEKKETIKNKRWKKLNFKVNFYVDLS